MKIKMLLGTMLAAVLLAGCCWKKCGDGQKNGEAKQAKLMAEAKISKETAQASALAQVPNGTIKEGELEKEHGKLIWSFDIATPDSADIKEIAVDAINGKIISIENETPADQAREAAEDAAKKKNGEQEEKD